MGGTGLRPPYQPLSEISDRVHRCGGYPNPLHVSFTVMWRIAVGGWWRLVWLGEVSGWGCGGFGGGVGLVQERALLCNEWGGLGLWNDF